MEVAVLLAEPGPEPQHRRAIAVAFLGLLRLAARDGLLLVAIDDEQWIDSASRSVLEFAIRRLSDERIAFLLTRRSDQDSTAPLALETALSPEQLTLARIGPLSLGALHELLRRRLGNTFSRVTLRRLAESTGGNPYFALEVGRAITAAGSRFETDEPLPVPESLQTLVGDRLRALPLEAREALLIASAPAKGWSNLQAMFISSATKARLQSSCRSPSWMFRSAGHSGWMLQTPATVRSEIPSFCRID